MNIEGFLKVECKTGDEVYLSIRNIAAIESAAGKGTKILMAPESMGFYATDTPFEEVIYMVRMNNCTIKNWNFKVPDIQLQSRTLKVDGSGVPRDTVSVAPNEGPVGDGVDGPDGTGHA